jgi:hypothetical protein
MLLCGWCGSVAVVGRRGRVAGGPQGGTRAPRYPGSERVLPRKAKQRQHGADRRRSLASHPHEGLIHAGLSHEGLSLDDDLSHGLSLNDDLSHEGLIRDDLSHEGLSHALSR